MQVESRSTGSKPAHRPLSNPLRSWAPVADSTSTRARAGVTAGSPSTMASNPPGRGLSDV